MQIGGVAFGGLIAQIPTRFTANGFTRDTRIPRHPLLAAAYG